MMTLLRTHMIEIIMAGMFVAILYMFLRKKK